MLHQLRIPGREAPLSWGHAGHFAPPGPQAHSPQGSEFPFPLQWMDFSWLSVWHTGFFPPNIPTERPFLTMRCPWYPACLLYPPHSTAPSRTLLFPLHLVPHSILRSRVSLLTAHLPPTTRAQTLAVCSAAASPARGPGIDTQRLLSEGTNTILPGREEVELELLQSDSRACLRKPFHCISWPSKPSIISKILTPNLPGRNDHPHLTDVDAGAF